MDVLGWRIIEEDTLLDIPPLSKEEEGLIALADERFREATRSCGATDREALVREMLVKASKEKGLYLDREQEGYLARIASMHIHGYAFLDPLLQDDDIEEISVIGPGMPAYVFFRGIGWRQVNACFESERAIADMINRMARGIGRRITLQNPRLDAMLPDGSRLHGSLPPVSRGEITIRKFRQRPYSPKELVESGTITLDELALLSALMQCDSSVLVAGNTASGKTTTMNALFSFVPRNERVIIAEETPEISIPHEHQLRLVANRDMGIGLKDLVYDSLRMRPDRMVVGEVRSRDEVEALFDVLLAGQARGSYATMHAQSAKEAVSRLRSYGIREMDMESIDCIIVQRRMLEYDPKGRRSREVRKVVEIAEMDGGPKPLGEDGRVFGRIQEGFGISRKELLAELKERKRLIRKAEPGYLDFFAYIQERLHGG